MLKRWLDRAIAAAVGVAAFFERNSHTRNLLFLSAVYWIARLVALRPVDKGGDAIWKWNIIRLWYETGSYPAFPPDHHQGRWMIVLPARALTALFGTDPWVYYAYPLVMGLAAAAAVYFIAARLRGRAAGAAAFALVAFAPKMIDESMQLCPLIPATAFTMLATLAMLRHFDSRRAIWTLAAGFLLALGYGCKVTMVYWYVPFALGLWLYRPAEADGRRPFPWRPLILLALGGAAVAAAEFFAFRAAFGVPLGRVSMITSGHLGNRIDPQYFNFWQYLFSFLRPLSLRGKFIYTFPTVLLTLLGMASALLWLIRKDTAPEKRFTALCVVWVYFLHSYVVYKVFPFLHPERNHSRYLLALFALGCVTAVCSLPEWRELLRKLPLPRAERTLPAAVWLLAAAFLVIAGLNPLANGEHLGRVLTYRRLLIRDGRPALLRLRPENGVLEEGEEKFARMYTIMYAAPEELKRLDEPRPWFTDGRGRLYMRLWGDVPEDTSIPVRVCDRIFCTETQLTLKRAKNR